MIVLLHLLLPAVLVNGIVLLGLGLSGHEPWVLTWFWGALLPVLLSSLLLGIAERLVTPRADSLQNLHLVGFFAKVILVGVWLFLFIPRPEIQRVVFTVSLLVNFLAWHVVEAYHWPLFLRRKTNHSGE